MKQNPLNMMPNNEWDDGACLGAFPKLQEASNEIAVSAGYQGL